MSIHFGVGTLQICENLLLSNCAITTAAVSGNPVQNVAVTSGQVMIDGVTAVVSGNANWDWSQDVGATGTGDNNLIYAYIASGDTVTATLAWTTANAPFNTATNIPTAICPLARLTYGTGSAGISNGTLLAWSGGSATKTIAKVQNVSIPVSYEVAQMRGGNDMFPMDTQMYDGAVEGSFEFSNETATQNQFFGGIYTSAGAASGTWTLSGQSKPNMVTLIFQNVTDGITSTYRVMRAYLTKRSNDFTRTDYMNPSYNFVSQANNQGTVLTIVG
jgi:hypothetical protein